MSLTQGASLNALENNYIEIKRKMIRWAQAKIQNKFHFQPYLNDKLYLTLNNSNFFVDSEIQREALELVFINEPFTANKFIINVEPRNLYTYVLMHGILVPYYEWTNNEVFAYEDFVFSKRGNSLYIAPIPVRHYQLRHKNTQPYDPDAKTGHIYYDNISMVNEEWHFEQSFLPHAPVDYIDVQITTNNDELSSKSI